MLRPQEPPPFHRTSPLAVHAWGGELCSNFNYKPKTESNQLHLALYMDRHLSLVTIIKEVTSSHTECTRFNLSYSGMPAVALQWARRKTSCCFGPGHEVKLHPIFRPEHDIKLNLLSCLFLIPHFISFG